MVSLHILFLSGKQETSGNCYLRTDMAMEMAEVRYKKFLQVPWLCHNSLSLQIACWRVFMLKRVKIIIKEEAVASPCLPGTVQGWWNFVFWWGFVFLCRKKLPPPPLVCSCHKCCWQLAIFGLFRIPGNVL